MMNVLFIGDIYGRPGREIVKQFLPDIRREHQVDFVIANCENIAHGSGFRPKDIKEMQGVGVDFFTTGNHVWSVAEGADKLDDPSFPVLRPANYPEGYTSGDGYRVVEIGNKKLLIINLMGRSFMKVFMDCPFRKADEILQEFEGQDLDGIFVDFHAETTAEKYALAIYLDGRISGMVGTHTHVPTADGRVLPSGSAFMCDVGMSGVIDSVIGLDAEGVIQSFITQRKQPRKVAEHGKKAFNAFLVELDDESKKALNAYHIQKFVD